MDDGKILGIDYGESKVGLAISEGELAEPLGVVSSKYQVLSICQRDRVEKIVIGLSEGKMAGKTKKFGEELANLTGLPVEYHDETLTTKEARGKMIEARKPRMKKKSSEHAIAAAIILQDYLDNLG